MYSLHWDRMPCVCVCACLCVHAAWLLRTYEPLTDDVHLAEIQADFGEGGDAGSGVVSSTVTVLSSGAVVWTLGGVIEPGKHTSHFNTISPVAVRKTNRALWWNRLFLFFCPVSCLPEAKDLWKILPFSRCQSDVLLWSFCLHSCTVDLKKKIQRKRRRRKRRGGNQREEE